MLVCVCWSLWERGYVDLVGSGFEEGLHLARLSLRIGAGSLWLDLAEGLTASEGLAHFAVYL